MPNDSPSSANGVEQVDLDVLDEIQRRVLWLATRIVDAANHDRDTADGVKVGGHQASSASLVTAMTALWFAHLDGADRVSVKPHASPVFHAIQYLLGHLDRRYLTTLRARGGLQSYPSRTKDPDRDYVDFSTGSVGLGAAAPLFAAAVRRYVDSHFGPRPRSRFISLLGDAELDEGNIWEAINDPATQGLGNVLWVIDFNRQSLDRVVPGVRTAQFTAQFTAAGWHVLEVKYGKRLTAQFAQPHGAALRAWIDAMPNERYQALFGYAGDELPKRFVDGAPNEVGASILAVPDEQLATLIQDLGGHDLASMLEAYAACDAVVDRPSVIFAYTVKGFGLPMAGNPRNHSALLSTEQIDTLRHHAGLTADTEWDRLDPASPAGQWTDRRARALARPAAPTTLAISVPTRIDDRPAHKPISTQEAFGRLLTSLSRLPDLAPYLVTTAPDVATSTNLAGFINRMGVYAPADLPDSLEPDTLLRWQQSPQGQHIELGISEMNLFLLLGQLGLAGELSGQRLLPIGTVYDPFVCRGLDAFIYGTYSGSRFIVAGTPSGVTLAPEGGAHQSTITAGIGLQLPGVTLYEPAYVGALDWQLCAALAGVASGEQGGSAYFRLTTRPLDQAPFEAA
jgi:pyruvate dehydrogenase E1 component